MAGSILESATESNVESANGGEGTANGKGPGTKAKDRGGVLVRAVEREETLGSAAITLDFHNTTQSPHTCHL